MKNISIGLICFILLAPYIVFADTYKLSILPAEPVTVKPNVLSGQMTVQSQDENDSQSKTTEKIILTFESSSDTGQFFTATGKDLSGYKYISNDTYNRNFSYQDSTEGTVTISVTGIGEVTGRSWTATKTISISSGASVSNNYQTITENEEKEETSLSATSGSVAPSYSTPSSQLEVSAGGDRITSPGSPINFQAIIKKNTSSDGSVKFAWSFGDGSVGAGALVSHSYKYPGDYAVVLNASSGNTFAISRLKVKVAEPNLAIETGDEFIEISNNSNYEINLFNWKVASEGKGFIFQPDTIILPKSKIKLDKSILSMKGEAENDTALINFLGDEVAKFVEPVAPEKIEEINSKVAAIRREIAQVTLAQTASVKTVMPQTASVLTSFEEPVMTASSVPEIIYESKPNRGFFSRFVNFVANIFK